MERWLKIEEFYAFQKVTFYTVRFEDEEMSETDKFFDLIAKKQDWQENLNKLIAFIEIMGEEKGAKKDFFRPEERAEALPPEYRQSKKYDLVEFLDYDLRLYCMRLSDNVVILFSGGIKSSQKVQDSPDLLPKFRMAQRFARSIDEKIKLKELKIAGKSLIGDDFFFKY